MTSPPWWLDPMADCPMPGPIRLESLKLGAYIEATTEFHLRLMENPDFRRDMHDRVRYQLTARALGQRVPPLTTTRAERLVVEVPATWWQHWKMAHLAAWWLPRWVTRRWPVRTRVVSTTVTLTGSVERAVLFPEASIVPEHPALGRPVMLVQDPDWRATRPRPTVD